MRESDWTLKASPGLPPPGGAFFVGEKRHLAKPSFPDVQLHIWAPLGARPESILPIVVMDSGLARFARAPE
jgi:hypothetical protein